MDRTSEELSINGVTVRHSSESFEYFTPEFIVKSAICTLGDICVDPFSCAEANAIIKARKYFSLERNEDGFTQPWYPACKCGHPHSAFVNPPGGKTGKYSNQKLAWFKLLKEINDGNLDMGIFICFSVELLQTTQVNPEGKLPLEFPICYPSRRIAYNQTGGSKAKSPPHSSCIVLVSTDELTISRFKIAFHNIGHIVVPR